MTNPTPSGTNPAESVTNSANVSWLARLAALPARPVQLAVAGAWLVVHASINAVSVASDLARRGVQVHAAEPWIWEFSSGLSLWLWLWPVLAFDLAVRARVRRTGLRLAMYAGASVVFSVGHVATMVAFRHIAYRVAGWQYDFGPWGAGLVYEYRKDLLTFLTMLIVAAAWRYLVTRAPVAPPDPAPVSVPDVAPVASPSTAPTFIARTPQGDLLVRAAEIDWIEAQGNYVALHVGSELRLLRQTLSEMESRLQDHGFIRTHRCALVNRLRVQAILSADSDAPGVRLSSGQVAPLSEGRRAEVVRLVLG